MARAPEWKTDEVLAWTSHDGPAAPPPTAHRGLWLVLAGVLGAVFTGMILSDTLCPEHRAWVKTLGAMALIGTGVAVVGLIRGWAGAPIITLLSASLGVVIGIIDAAHDPTQGRVIALAFAFAMSGAGLLCLRQWSTRRWHDAELASSPALTMSTEPVRPQAPAPDAQPITVPSAR